MEISKLTDEQATFSDKNFYDSLLDDRNVRHVINWRWIEN